MLAAGTPTPEGPLPFVVRQPSVDGGAWRSMSDVAVAADGFVWVASAAGPVRFDGRRLTSPPWLDSTLPIETLAASGDGPMYGLTRGGELVAMTAEALRWIDGPSDVGPLGRLATDDGDAVWVGAKGRAFRLDRGGWREPLAAVLEPGERVVNLRRRDGQLVVTTDRSVWAVMAGRPVRLVRRPQVYPIVEALVLPSGAVVTMTFDGLVERWSEGKGVVLGQPGGRGIDLQARGDALWASWDSKIGIFVGEEFEFWRIRHGGALELAPDGALLLAGAVGLWVLPEPDTRTVSFQPGILGVSVRDLWADDARVWASTWAGAAVMDIHSARALRDGPSVLRGAICPDGVGGAWTAARTEIGSHFWVWRPPDEAVAVAEAPGAGGCAVDRRGGVWLGADRSVWHVTRGQARPVRVADAPLVAREVVLDDYGQIWIGERGQVCVAMLGGLELGPWRCHTFGDGSRGWVGAIHATGPDTALVATFDDGLFRVGGGLPERHPAADPVLRSLQLEGLHPSPRGGIWVSGYDAIVRVDPLTFQEYERLDAWHGLSAVGAHAALELPDGAIWVGGATGLMRVAPTSRVTLARASRPQLLDLTLDGRRLPAADPVAVPSPPSALTLNFVAPSYRDPSRVRYRLRRGTSEPVPLPEPSLQLVDLQPGTHRIAVEASLDGRVWSEPAVVTVEVALPWWRAPWALLAMALGVVGLVGLAAQWRASVLVARERERTRLAMDLHDELGSALGSIRLLADVLGRPQLDDAARQNLAGRLAGTAREVHESLQVLVGALRPGAATVGALLDRLESRARAALEPLGAEVRVVASPQARRRSLAVSVRSELERIGLEALHNAARHGRPSSVTVGFAALADRFELWVVDDGSGFDPAMQDGDGLGLHTMRERAERIGGALSVVAAPGKGCRISVVFAPTSAPERRRNR